MTMPSPKWFYQFNQIIKGPVTTSDLEKIISTLSNSNSNSKNTYIWARGYTEWVSADRWQPNQDIFENDITTPGVITSSETFRVQLNFIDQPLMTKDELMAFAARAEDPSQVAIFDPLTNEWKEIYAFSDIVEKLGLSRRKQPRVPILAQFTGRSSKHETFEARLVTLSLLGFGLTDVFELQIGDTVTGQITSPHFYLPVTLDAEVTYSGHDGYVGLKFLKINDDSLALVTDYVKRFSGPSV